MHTRESNLLLPSPDNARPNSFSDLQSHDHVSTLFQQSFNLEAPLFRHVPVLRRVSVLEKAQFRLGYSVMFIGYVVDPANSIQWNGNPAAGLFPFIKDHHTTFVTSFYNFGLGWKF